MHRVPRQFQIAEEAGVQEALQDEQVDIAGLEVGPQPLDLARESLVITGPVQVGLNGLEGLFPLRLAEEHHGQAAISLHAFTIRILDNLIGKGPETRGEGVGCGLDQGDDQCQRQEGDEDPQGPVIIDTNQNQNQGGEKKHHQQHGVKGREDLQQLGQFRHIDEAEDLAIDEIEDVMGQVKEKNGRSRQPGPPGGGLEQGVDQSVHIEHHQRFRPLQVHDRRAEATEMLHQQSVQVDGRQEEGKMHKRLSPGERKGIEHGTPD